MRTTFVASLVAAAVHAAAADGPVDKVVTLLKDLKSGLENDEKTEQGIYDKYACWCEETTGRKAQNIEDGRSDMKRLGQMILKQKGIVSVRTDEIEEKEAQIKENEELQESATTSRGKENAAWQADTEETSQAMTAINAAMEVLTKGTKSSLLQQDATARLRVSVSKAVDVAPAKALAGLDPEKLAQLRSFVQVKAGYAPQSMTIQGILSDLYKTMGIDIQEATVTEGKRNRAYENYMHEKTEEHAKLSKILKKKQKEKAEAESMLAEASEAYDDTSNQLDADVKFFDVTKEACKTKTEEWKVRSNLREDEIEGIAEALKILTSPEAKKLFAKSIKPGMEATFLQIGSSKSDPKQGLEKLYGKLKARASESHSLRLASLAAQVRMAKAGHFDKVMKAIDDLIVVLGKEQDSDTKKRDECEEQYQDIAKESAELEWKIKNNKATITKLKNLIKDREADKKQTVEDIKDTKENIKDMKKERKKENAEFVQAKKDDEASIELLKKAKEAILDFYKKNKVAMGEIQGSVKLLQEGASPLEDPDKAPDATFSGKGKRKGQTKGAVSLLTMVIEDLQAEIVNEVKAEKEAQLSFEQALDAAETLLKKLEAKKVSLEDTIARHKKDKKDEEKDKKANEDDLDDQKEEKKSIQEDCDYMIEKYEERRKYREAEAEALSDAKEFLANYYDSADEAAFVQSSSKGSSSKLTFRRLVSPHLRK